MYRTIRRYFLSKYFARRNKNPWVARVLPYKKHIDGFILSHQRAGRYWTLSLLATYFNQFYHLKLDNDHFDTFKSIIPFKPDNIAEFYRLRQTRFKQIPFLVPSHLPYNINQKELFQNKDLIILLRSIEDMMLSFYYKKSAYGKNYESDLSSFLRDESLGMPNVCRYYNYLAEHIPVHHFLVIRYEDLHHDTEKHLTDILSFLNVPIDTALLHHAIAHNSFTEMQDRYIKTGEQAVSTDKETPNALLVRQGQIGESKETMSSEDLTYVDDILKQELSPNAKAFLNQHLNDRDYLK